MDKAWVDKMKRLQAKNNTGSRVDYSRYLDSDPVEFDGDIIITDPCYILNKDSDDWDLCEYGDHMENLGIEHQMTRDTIFGDWSCTVFDLNSGKSIGEFCADAGMVAVLLLDDVLKYNPGFDYHIDRPWTTALIKDFKGTVQFVVKEVSYEYNGKPMINYEVEGVGHGVNKRTNAPIDFVGRQTGL